MAVLLYATTTLSYAAAGEGGKELTSRGIREFEEAVRIWDGALLHAAGATFESAASLESQAFLPRYWLAVTRFHQVLYQEFTPGVSVAVNDQAKARDACQKALDEALRLDPQHAEAHAMLGTLFGIRIAKDKMSGIWLGPKVVDHRNKALAKGAENPRVQYLAGMSYFHGPSFLGGKAAALRTLSKAAELFAAESRHPAEPGIPRWGRVNCLVFLGMTQRAQGDLKAAKESLSAALALNAHDRIAQSELRQLNP